jgi:hypothetical protein
MIRHPGRCPLELSSPVVLLRIRPSKPPQQSAHRQCVCFSLVSFDMGAFLALPRAKPDDDTAVERRSISASRNAFSDQCNPQGRDGLAPANCVSFLHLIFDRIGAVGEGFVRAGFDTGIPYALGGQSDDSGGASVSHPRSPNAERSSPGGAYHPDEP